MADTQFEMWLEKTNEKFEKEWLTPNSEGRVTSIEYKPLTYKKGKKFVKVLRDRGVWGFVSMVDNVHKNSPIKPGDLLLAAGWSTPARHARGNIFDGTASYSMYGPSYIK
jgi:hypothetical protein